MGAMDKIKNAVQEHSGKAKETVGEHTGNEQMVAEGEKDQAAGDLKQRGEHIKDAFRS